VQLSLQPDFVGAWIRQGQKTRSKTYVLKAAQIFDGKSTPSLASFGYCDGGKIVGIGASAKLPADAQVIDFGDCHAGCLASLTPTLT